VKVAFISFDFGEYCSRLAGALAAEAEVLLLLPHNQITSSVSIPRDLQFQPFHKPRLRQIMSQARMLRALIERVKSFDPDVVHLQQGHLWFNLALPLLGRIPLVLTVHDAIQHPGDRGAKNTPQAISDFGFRRAHQLIVHGRYIKQLFLERHPIAPQNVHVIPHIAMGDASARPEIAEREYQILFFGRIWRYKGLEYLIQAAPLITARVPEAKIVIAGIGEDFDRYRRLMKNPQTFVVYNEYISNEKQSELFRQSSLIVLPYIEASQSGVIPLAYTFSKPVVATTVGALPEMVEDGGTGYLVSPCDVKALADAVVRLLLDRELRHGMGATGKTKIDNECSAEVIAQQTLAVYRAAIAGHAHARGNATWALER
jgi:glycosyltransferase involved in cell wall biosynthesis